MTKYIYSFFTLFIPFLSFGQDCNCKQLLKESIQKIESAYAGYPDKYNSKLNKRVINLLLESTNTKNEYSCAKLIFKYVSLFEERHMPLILDDSISSSISLTALPKNHFLNGEWSNRDGSYSVSFKKSIDNSYIGIIAKSKNPDLKVGQSIIEIYNERNRYLVAFSEGGQTYFSTLKVEKNSITIDLIEMFSKTLSIEKYKTNSTTELKTFQDSIAILHLPRFSQKSSKKISLFSDSIYNNNKIKYLIFDIRSNPGGDPDVFYSLRKLYYENPISFPDISFRVSQEMREIDSLNQNPLFEKYKDFKNGSFYTEKIDTFYLNEKPKKLKKIYVLTDRFTGSSAEVFVNEVLQSKNVITIGETTNGVVDYFRATPFYLQNKKFILQIPLGRLNWDTKIDKTGISPNIDLSKIKTKWIDYILRQVIPK